MLLGTQWYILFNVIAGAMAIPSEMREVADLFRFTTIQRWKTVILPGIFPYLITGLVTASGGAWNASIIAEYFHLKDHTLTPSASARRSAPPATRRTSPSCCWRRSSWRPDGGHRQPLLWRPLYHLAETKYRLDQGASVVPFCSRRVIHHVRPPHGYISSNYGVGVYAWLFRPGHIRFDVRVLHEDIIDRRL
jgi:hypothetical protein